MKHNSKLMQAPELPVKDRDPPQRKTQAPQLPKKNPSYRYCLKAQKSGGPVMTWNGERFTTNEPFKSFSKASAATGQGKKLVKQFSILKDYRVWVAGQFIILPVKGAKQRAMRGGSKLNPVKRSHQAELDEAAKKLEDFSGHPVQHLESAYSRSSQNTGLIIGELDLVGYRAKRDGKTERYGHHFKKHSRPLLAVTSDGKQLHIVGGQYEFTEAGIEDR